MIAAGLPANEWQRVKALRSPYQQGG